MSPEADRPVGLAWRRVLLGLAALLVAVALDDALFPVYPRHAPSLNQGENGLWLRYRWYLGEKSEADWAGLPELLSRNQIRCAYFHVREIDRDGSLIYHKLEGARRIVETVHAGAPDVKVIAWVYAGNARGNGEVELSRPEVRAKMIDEARWLTAECGFHGVQWDYEICPDGDPGFLALMRETRAALPDIWLSTAVPMVAGRPWRRWRWSPEYFQQVAAYADDIGIMAYDSGWPLRRGYAALVKRQAAICPVLASRANPSCRVLIGVPTYEAGPRAHHPHAENLAMALAAVKGAGAHSSLAGVAIFADYTTDGQEWRLYRERWLGRQG